MRNKKTLLTTGMILFIIGIAIMIIVAVTNSDDDIPGIYYGSDITTEEYSEPVIDPELAFLTEHRWVRENNCEEHITFARDGFFSYSCSCGSAVDNYDIYDSFEYNNGIIYVKGYDEEDILMRLVYHDENYLCLFLEEEKECRVFIDEDLANDPYAEHSPYRFASDNWIEIHALGYDGKYLKAAPYNYDGDARDEFKEYIKDLAVSGDIEFYSVTSIDNNGELATEHFKLEESDIEHIGEYYTGGYAQFDKDGNIRYVVFYGKTIIQG